MGYLDNRTITVDAVLTKKGRELLSKGRSFFNITKFSLSDDEVDYHLWNPLHPSGSNYYGVAIEQMPVLEASPDETQVMRYKLVSLDKNTTTKMPYVSVPGVSAISFQQNDISTITPQTTYVGTSGGATGISLNGTYGYTAILHNSDIAYLQVTNAAPATGDDEALQAKIADLRRQAAAAENAGASIRANELEDQADAVQAQLLALLRSSQGAGTGVFLGDTESAKSVWATGMAFRLIAKQLTSNASLSSTLTIVGNETGGTVSIPITNRRIKLVKEE